MNISRRECLKILAGLGFSLALPSLAAIDSAGTAEIDAAWQDILSLKHPSKEDEILAAILFDAHGIGIRSRIPKHYIWKDDLLILVGAIAVKNMGCGYYGTLEINKRISKRLDVLCVKHIIQDILSHSSNSDNRDKYWSGTLGGIFSALKESSEWAYKNRRTRENLLAFAALSSDTV